MNTAKGLTTGVAALDALLRGIKAGDNVVWQVDSVDDYRAFAVPFAEHAVLNGRPVHYFRFGRHEPLFTPGPGVTVHEVDPQAGFEPFIDTIHAEIALAGRGAFYVFDCLSDLVADWFSDQMLGNFFMLTCPYLFDMDTVAYFSLLRRYHSGTATGPIRKTTQLLLDVYRHGEHAYVRPIKVRQRYLPTLHMLHVIEEHGFRPVTESHVLAEVLSGPGREQDVQSFRADVWTRSFFQAGEMLTTGQGSGEERAALFRKLLRMAVSRDERVLRLLERHLTLEDVLAIGRRTVGTGLIGGKAVGMLLARAILRRTDPRWQELLETHDSFYVASDVFYSFLVENGCWWIRKQQRNPDSFLEGASQARRRILTGSFSPGVIAQFREMLEYYGRSPIIVRSSSLLEDNFGNAFAGKYDSIFCPNQGSLDQRLDEFIQAAKAVYASSMGEEALAYRARHGLLDRDEQMALLVQRVSGANRGRYFYPTVAGVGFSFNPYVWSSEIDPKAGILRLVFGLGTRAVDRNDDDYIRIIALNAPERRPEGEGGDGPPCAQQRVDLLNLEDNSLGTVLFDEAVAGVDNLPLDLLAPPDAAMARRNREVGRPGPPPRYLTFDGLLGQTPFIEDIRAMLSTLEAAYEYPVDVEIAANIGEAGEYKINVVQCRPLQARGGAIETADPGSLPDARVLLEGSGPIIGRSRAEPVNRIIYVSPEHYGVLPRQERYAVARLIGRLTRTGAGRGRAGGLMLIGPGRWGTSSPELGVPVTFAEINQVGILCELVAMREDLVPDVSMGTHFFCELVEMDMLYAAFFPGRQGHRILLEAGLNEENHLLRMVPEAERFENVVRVCDVDSVHVHADTIQQRFLCFRG